MEINARDLKKGNIIEIKNIWATLMDPLARVENVELTRIALPSGTRPTVKVTYTNLSTGAEGRTFLEPLSRINIRET